MNIDHLSIPELKVLVYDQLALLEQCQRNISVINQRIEFLSKNTVTAVPANQNFPENVKPIRPPNGVWSPT